MSRLTFFAIAVACDGANSRIDATGNTVSSLAVEGARIKIDVPVNIVGADPSLLNRWRQAIDHVWNTGDEPALKVCGRQLHVTPRFTVQSSALASADSHLVIVEPIGVGQRYVSQVRHELGTSPSYSPRTGFWASNMDARTVAHEFGHLLGLLDEYLEDDGNDNGVREPGERPRPDVARYPDAASSLMASEHGVVLPRHVHEIVRMHGGEHLLDCR